MANPYQGPSGFNPDTQHTSFLPRYRNMSTTSVVPGSNPTTFTPQSHSPLNRLSYLLNPPYEAASDLYAAIPSSQRHSPTTDTDMNIGGLDGEGASSQPRAPQLPRHSRAFEPYMLTKVFREGAFFTPSYLRGSDYIQKLAEAHRARQAQKETQQQSGDGLPAGITAASSLGSKTPASHLGMTYDLIERVPAVENDNFVAPLPTKWNKDDKHGALEVIADGQEVKYAAIRHTREQEHETCSIRADHPMPWQAGIYYFEVTLLAKRRDEYVHHDHFTSCRI